MRLVRVSEPRMSSCLAGAGQNTATSTTAAYGFDLEIELLKSTSASIRASPYSLSSSSSASSFSLSSCFTSSSPNSISESSNSPSPPLSICTRKPRTPRKRPNQTYKEAAALLSTAYPNIFSPKHLAKAPSIKFAKPIDSTSWLNSAIGEELLLPLSLPEKTFDRRLGLVNSSSCSTYSDYSSEKPCQSPMEENGFREDDDFDAESILDEEIEGGIDSIMGNLTVRSDNIDHNQHQQTGNFCYGFPMGLGLLGSRFDFGFSMAKGVRALRNPPDGGYGGSGEWWRFPSLTTVDVGAISPRLQKKPGVEKKKSRSSSKKKKVPEEKEKEGEGAANDSMAAAPPAREESPAANCSDCLIQLKLNYDDVLSAWSDRGSPFSDNSPASELSGTDTLARLAQIDLFGENEGVREASVQRYKEKRRTRLFPKKIRYQVRKVNADQRPRMKGRFVRSPDSSAGVQT